MTVHRLQSISSWHCLGTPAQWSCTWFALKACEVFTAASSATRRAMHPAKWSFSPHTNKRDTSWSDPDKSKTTLVFVLLFQRLWSYDLRLYDAIQICVLLFKMLVRYAAGSVRAYSKCVSRTNCALRIKKCAPRISSGIYFLSTS